MKIMNTLSAFFKLTLYLCAIIFPSFFSGCLNKGYDKSIAQQDDSKSIPKITTVIDTAGIIAGLHEECERLTLLMSKAEIVPNYRCNESVTDHEDVGDSEVFECYDTIFNIEKGNYIRKNYCIRTNNVGLYKELELTYFKDDSVFCVFKQFTLERELSEEYLLEENIDYFYHGNLLTSLNRKCECMGCNVSEKITKVAWSK